MNGGRLGALSSRATNLLALSLLVGLAGCAVGPVYHRPQTAAPANWSEPMLGGATNSQPQIVQWWATFHDPELDSLIQRAAQSNYDVKIAEARVLQARALWNGALWNFAPSGDFVSSYTDARRSRNSLSFPVTQLKTDMLDMHFDASWEIDIFGKVRRGLESARAQLQAVEEDRRDVLVSLLAEVARNYISVRGLQTRLDIAHKNIKTQQDALEIARARFKAGLASELDVTQAASLLATTQSQLPTLQTLLQQGIHRLGVLLGQAPGALMTELEAESPIPAVPPEVPVGLPSDLLRRRPDVRRAERDLASSTALIGVATADLFPRFFLTGIGGLQSLKLSDWLTAGSRFWSAGPSITWPIFDIGQIHANIRAANAVQQQSLANYQKSVLGALEDVENALVAYDKEQTRYQSLNEAAAANRRALQLSNELYKQGLVDFLNVLDAERSLYQAEDQLVQSQQTVSLNLVTLYKALGGGWESDNQGKLLSENNKKN
jgi:multidrug efflux system outer membrane protein